MNMSPEMEAEPAHKWYRELGTDHAQARSPFITPMTARAETVEGSLGGRLVWQR